MSKSEDNIFIALCFHRILKRGEDSLFTSMVNASPTEFEQELRFLSRNFSIISINELLKNGRAGKKTNKIKLIITFDDGYNDFYYNAYPILKKMGIPSIVYITTDSLENKDFILWTDRVAFMVDNTKKSFINLAEFGFLPLRSERSRESAKIKIVEKLKSINEPQKNFIIERIEKQLEVDLPKTTNGYYLKKGQIQEMKKDFITFGSHTCSHPILTRISLSKAEREIRDSKAKLEDILGHPIESFAYPNGTEKDFNADIKRLVSDSGYKLAFSMIEGENATGSDLDMFELRRVNAGTSLRILNKNLHKALIAANPRQIKLSSKLKAKSNGVLMVTGSFLPEITGGGVQCSNLIKVLSGTRQYYIITTAKDKSLPQYEPRKWGEIYRIYINPQSILSKILCLFGIVRAFLKIKNRIGIVHLHGFSTKSIIFVLLGKAFRKKIIIKLTSLGDDDPISLKKRQSRIHYWCYKWADLFISVSPGITDTFKRSELSNKSLEQIPNSVDILRFRPIDNIFDKQRLRQALNLPEAATIILVVGFFSYDKGVDIAYKAWKAVKESFADSLHLVIVGSTDSSYFEISQELVDFIKADISDSHLEGHVTLIESSPCIEDYYRACDIFVMPSLREGLPNVLLEAMASGMPVLASKIKGVTDYIIRDEVSGHLFERGNIRKLTEKMLLLINNKSSANCLGREARKKIEAGFGISRLGPIYDNLYDNLIGSGEHA